MTYPEYVELVTAAEADYARRVTDWRASLARDRATCPHARGRTFYCLVHHKVCPASPETLQLERSVEQAHRALSRAKRARFANDPPTDVCGLYLMQDGDHFKIGQSVHMKDRLSQIRSHFPATEMHSYLAVPPERLSALEGVLLDWAYRYVGERRCDRCAAGDWFCLDEAGVIHVQRLMQSFTAR